MIKFSCKECTGECGPGCIQVIPDVTITTPERYCIHCHGRHGIFAKCNVQLGDKDILTKDVEPKDEMVRVTKMVRGDVLDVAKAGGTKYDGEKPRPELIPSAELLELAMVMAKGAQKYGDANWKRGISISRLVGAMMRHAAQFNSGENKDAELQESHLACVAANALMALWTLKNKPEMDDR